MIALEKNATLVITDSGGVQKEAFFFQKPCIVLRPETEWVELVNGGFNFLVNPIDNLSKEINNLWEKEFPIQAVPLYGDGKTAEKIVEILSRLLG